MRGLMQSEQKWRRGLMGEARRSKTLKQRGREPEERDEGEGVFMLVRKGCESEMMEQK